MNQITVSDALFAKLKAVVEPVELVDENGRRLGSFTPDVEPKPLDDSPYTAEELAAMEAQTGGRPLSEIKKRLAAK